MTEEINVVVSYTVDEKAIFEGWTAEEIEGYREGDPEAVAAFEETAATMAIAGKADTSIEDCEVFRA